MMTTADVTNTGMKWGQAWRRKSQSYVTVTFYFTPCFDFV